MIDGIDCIACIKETAGNGIRLRIAWDRAPHQRRAEEIADEAVIRGLSRRKELRKAQDGDRESLCAIGDANALQTRKERPYLRHGRGHIRLRRHRARCEHHIA